MINVIIFSHEAHDYHGTNDCTIIVWDRRFGLADNPKLVHTCVQVYAQYLARAQRVKV